MSRWRQTALKLLPSLKQTIEEAQSPMALWIDLHFKLRDAYEAEPRDERLIAALFCYATWCQYESRNKDISTAVIVAFFEHLPTHPNVRADMPNQLTLQQFDDLHDVFRYHLAPEEFDQFIAEFQKQMNDRACQAAAKKLPPG